MAFTSSSSSRSSSSSSSSDADFSKGMPAQHCHMDLYGAGAAAPAPPAAPPQYTSTLLHHDFHNKKLLHKKCAAPGMYSCRTSPADHEPPSLINRRHGRLHMNISSCHHHVPPPHHHHNPPPHMNQYLHMHHHPKYMHALHHHHRPAVHHHHHPAAAGRQLGLLGINYKRALKRCCKIKKMQQHHHDRRREITKTDALLRPIMKAKKMKKKLMKQQSLQHSAPACSDPILMSHGPHPHPHPHNHHRHSHHHHRVTQSLHDHCKRKIRDPGSAILEPMKLQAKKLDKKGKRKLLGSRRSCCGHLHQDFGDHRLIEMGGVDAAAAAAAAGPSGASPPTAPLIPASCME